MENWKDIDGYEGLYQVSTLGRVRSLDRLVWNEHNKDYNLCKGRILKIILDKDGYQLVHLYKVGKGKMHKVHRIVAQSFIPNPNNLPQVNHINECKTDNMVENLEWCDCRYNINFGTRNKKAAKSNTNGIRSKRVAQINPQTNEIIRIWQSTHECGRNGFSQGSVAACCRGERYKTHHGYRWQYVEDSI